MQAITRLYTSFQPKHYELDLTLLRKERRFVGTVIITGTAQHRDHLSLHAKELVISSVKVNDADATFTHEQDDELRIVSDAIKPHEEYRIQVEFSGHITNPMHGLYPCYFEHEGKKKELLATQFESHHAREVFPCVDEPEAKATFDLTLTTEQDITVLSNTPVKEQNKTNDHLVTTFETTPKMSTYLLAFVVGELQYREAVTKSGVVVRAYATHAQPADGLDFPVAFAAQVIDFFNDYFGVDYPLVKADMVAVPDFSAGAMENWGLITYRESTLLVDPQNSSVSQKQYVATVVAHELSHQWFGNLVTMQWWNDLWLNESFAAMMECVAIDAIHPDWDCWLDFASHDTVVSLRRDCLPGVQPVSLPVHHPDQISTLFDPAIVYAKGANVLKMLRAYIGEDAFRKGLQAYFNKHAFGNTVADDLWDAFSHASGHDIGAFMHAWIYKPGYPMVTVKQDGSNASLHQRRLLMSDKDYESLWPVPLFPNHEMSVPLLEQRKAEAQLESDKPLMLNLGGNGFFVTHYEDEEHQAYIRRQLESGIFAPIDRLRILHETLLLARGGELPLVEAVKLISAYKHEDKDAIWDMIALVISDARHFSEHNKEMEDGLKRLVLELVREQFERLGTAPRDSDTEEERKLRASIYSLAVWAEYQPAVDAALADFDRFEKPQELPVDLRGIVYSAGARWRGIDGYHKLLALYKASTSAEERQSLASSMSATRDTEIIKKLLGHVTDPKIVRTQDVAFWLIYLIRKKHGRELTWEWLTNSWDWIEEHFKSDKSYDDYPRYASGALLGQEWLKRYSDFFTPLLDDVALHRAITIGIEDIRARTEWFERDEPSLREYLTQIP
ncbi:M1 family metallopeptidase [Candidatus Saccharibacteria bacterium]|nr:M1 family metallopeptidase [Candidatus Saccharibacteria bacterium]